MSTTTHNNPSPPKMYTATHDDPKKLQQSTAAKEKILDNLKESK